MNLLHCLILVHRLITRVKVFLSVGVKSQINSNLRVLIRLTVATRNIKPDQQQLISSIQITKTESCNALFPEKLDKEDDDQYYNSTH